MDDQTEFIPFAVYPERVEFQQISTRKLYIMNISVQNTTSVAQTIRISPPTSPFFAVNYDPLKVCAPGMSFDAEIEFQLPDDQNFQDCFEFIDSLKIGGEYGILTIPLVAKFPIPSFELSRNLINFGPIPSDLPPSETIFVTNHGNARGSWSIDGGDVCEVDPSEGDLEIGEEMEVSVRWKTSPTPLSPTSQNEDIAAEGGRGLLSLVNGVTGRREAVCDVSALVCPISSSDPTPFTWKAIEGTEGSSSSVSSYDLGESLNFGVVWRGREKIFLTEIANKSALPIQFKVALVREGEDNEEDCDNFKVDISDLPSPLPPFSSFMIPIKFSPLSSPPDVGFSHTMDFTNPFPSKANLLLSASLSSRKWKKSISLEGTTFTPLLHTSSTFLPFQVGFGADGKDETLNPILPLTLSNPTSAPISFSYSPKVPSFNITPSEGTIAPGSDLTLSVQFTPRSTITNSKTLRRKLKFSVEGGLQIIEVKAKVEIEVGFDSGRILKPWEDTISNSFSWRESEMKEEEEVEQWMKDMTYSLEELERRDKHKQQYVEYMRTKRTQNEEAIIRAQFDNDALEEPPLIPLPSFPTTNEFYEEYRKVAVSASRPQTNSKALKPRVFKMDPSSPAEERDCGVDITSMDVLEVGSELDDGKLDYGFVSPSTTSLPQSLYVTNTSNHSVQVFIQRGDDDKKGNKRRKKGKRVTMSDDLLVDGSEESISLMCDPPRQVIPPNQTALFNVLLSSPPPNAPGYDTSKVIKQELAVVCNAMSSTSSGLKWLVPLRCQLMDHSLFLSTLPSPPDIQVGDNRNHHKEGDEKAGEEDESLIYCQDLESPLNFSFGDQSGNYKKEGSTKLFIHNPHSSICPFILTSPSSLFVASPSQGDIQPRSYVEVVVSWKPLNGKKSSRGKNKKANQQDSGNEVIMIGVQVGSGGKSGEFGVKGNWFESGESLSVKMPTSAHPMDVRPQTLDFGEVRVLDSDEVGVGDFPGYKASLSISLIKKWSSYLKSLDNSSTHDPSYVVAFAEIIKDEGEDSDGSFDPGIGNGDDVSSSLSLSSPFVTLHTSESNILDLFWVPQSPTLTISDYFLQITPRLPNSSPIKLPLVGSSVIPPIMAVPSSINAGVVSKGTERSWEVNLTNNHPNLQSRISLSSGESSLSYALLGRRKQTVGMIEEEFEMKVEDQQENGEGNDDVWDMLPAPQKSGVVMIESGEEVKFLVTWHPRSLPKYGDPFSVSILGGNCDFIGEIISRIVEIQYPTASQNSQQIIKTSDGKIDFGKIVINPLPPDMSDEDKDMIEKPSYTASFNLSNTSTSTPSSFSLDLKLQNRSEDEGDTNGVVFSVTPSSGNIPPQESIPVHLVFTPSPITPASYLSTLTLQSSIPNENDTEESERQVIEGEVCITGESTWPIVDITESSISFPPLPITPSLVSSSGCVTFNNLGYSYCCLSHSIPNNLPFVLNVEYPSGREMGNEGGLPDSIPISFSIEPTAKSPSNLSFSVPVSFFLSTTPGDADGDGCILENDIASASQGQHAKELFGEIEVCGCFTNSFLLLGEVISSIIPPESGEGDNQSLEGGLDALSSTSSSSTLYPGILVRDGGKDGVLKLANNPSFIQSGSNKQNEDETLLSPKLLVPNDIIRWNEKEASVLGNLIISIFSFQKSSFMFPSSLLTSSTLYSLLNKMISEKGVREIKKKAKNSTNMKDILGSLISFISSHQLPIHHIEIDSLISYQSDGNLKALSSWCDLMILLFQGFVFPSFNYHPSMFDDSVTSNVLDSLEWGVMSWIKIPPQIPSSSASSSSLRSSSTTRRKDRKIPVSRRSQRQVSSDFTSSEEMWSLVSTEKLSHFPCPPKDVFTNLLKQIFPNLSIHQIQDFLFGGSRRIRLFIMMLIAPSLNAISSPISAIQLNTNVGNISSKTISVNSLISGNARIPELLGGNEDAHLLKTWNIEMCGKNSVKVDYSPSFFSEKDAGWLLLWDERCSPLENENRQQQVQDDDNSVGSNALRLPNIMYPPTLLYLNGSTHSFSPQSEHTFQPSLYSQEKFSISIPQENVDSNQTVSNVRILTHSDQNPSQLPPFQALSFWIDAVGDGDRELTFHTFPLLPQDVSLQIIVSFANGREKASETCILAHIKPTLPSEDYSFNLTAGANNQVCLGSKSNLGVNIKVPHQSSFLNKGFQTIKSLRGKEVDEITWDVFINDLQPLVSTKSIQYSVTAITASNEEGSTFRDPPTWISQSRSVVIPTDHAFGYSKVVSLQDGYEINRLGEDFVREEEKEETKMSKKSSNKQQSGELVIPLDLTPLSASSHNQEYVAQGRLVLKSLIDVRVIDFCAIIPPPSASLTLLAGFSPTRQALPMDSQFQNFSYEIVESKMEEGENEKSSSPWDFSVSSKELSVSHNGSGGVGNQRIKISIKTAKNELYQEFTIQRDIIEKKADPQLGKEDDNSEDMEACRNCRFPSHSKPVVSIKVPKQFNSAEYIPNVLLPDSLEGEVQWSEKMSKRLEFTLLSGSIDEIGEEDGMIWIENPNTGDIGCWWRITKNESLLRNESTSSPLRGGDVSQESFSSEREEHVVESCCEVSKAIQITVRLNKLISQGDLSCEIETEELGEQLFVYEVASTSITLIFTPFTTFSNKKASLVIKDENSNREERQVLVLSSVPRRREVIEIEGIVGGAKDIFIPIRNYHPSYPIHVKCYLEGDEQNDFVFQDDSKEFSIQPSSSISLPLSFLPANSDETSAVIIVEVQETDLIEGWEIEISGVGQKLDELPNVQGICELYSSETILVPFTNPTLNPLDIHLQLTSPTESMRLAEGRELNVQFNQEEDTIAPLITHCKKTVGGKKTFNIPIIFSPESLNSCHDSILVLSAPEFGWNWTIPIVGVVRITSETVSFQLQTFTHQTSVLMWEFPDISQSLNKIDQVDLSEFDINVSLDNKSTLEGEENVIVDKLLSKWLKLVPMITRHNSLGLKVIFSPLRPISASLELNISHLPSSSIFNYSLMTEVSHDLDGETSDDMSSLAGCGGIGDLTMIESEVGNSASEDIEIRNPFLNPLPFQAYFLAGSSLALSVFPREGMLLPDGGGSEDARNAGKVKVCSVTFNPTSYGGVGESGILVIKTEECEWTRRIKARQPLYQKPEVPSRFLDG